MDTYWHYFVLIHYAEGLSLAYRNMLDSILFTVTLISFFHFFK